MLIPCSWAWGQPWSVADIRCHPIGGLIFHLPEAISCECLLSGEWYFLSSSLLCWVLSSAGCHSLCEFVCASTLLCMENTVSLKLSTPQVFMVFDFLFASIPEPGKKGCDIDTPFRSDPVQVWPLPGPSVSISYQLWASDHQLLQEETSLMRTDQCAHLKLWLEPLSEISE